MIFDTEHYEEFGTIIFRPESEEEKSFLEIFFNTRHPTTLGLNADGSVSLITKSLARARRYKCDSLCIRFMEKECTTESEDDMCDQPDMYREIGDVADALNDEALFK